MTGSIEPQSNQSTTNHRPFRFTIRQFTQADQKTAAMIFKTTQAEFGLSPEYADYALQHDMADIEANYVRPPRSNFFCAVDDDNDEVVGIVGVRPMHVADPDYYNEVKAYTDPSLVAFDPDNCAELNRMAVIPRVRRSGVARSLLNHLVDWSRNAGYPHVHLCTLVTMRHAFNFYLRCGWINYRIYRGFYENDPKMQNDAMLKRNAELRAAGKGHLLEPCFNVSVDEVPLDNEKVREAGLSGILWVAHFYTSTERHLQ